MNMNIFGIYGGDDGFPVIEVLAQGYDTERNGRNENAAEVARRFAFAFDMRCACILLVDRNGESVAYSRKELLSDVEVPSNFVPKTSPTTAKNGKSQGNGE